MGSDRPISQSRAIEVNVAAGQARRAVAGGRAAAPAGRRDELVVVGGGAVLVAAPRGRPLVAIRGAHVTRAAVLDFRIAIVNSK